MATNDNVQVGFDNSGNLVAKNRAYRRKRRTTAELNGLPKSYYTTKQVKTRRKKNGKRTQVRKKSR